jgi:hypothetical protein
MKKTHPNLFKIYVLYALLSLGIGLNFILLRPAFMPLDIPKIYVGFAFFGCGLIKTVLLHISNNHKLLRLSMAMSVVIYSFWAGVLTFDFIRLSQTSLQLPLTYIGLSLLGAILLFEPFMNPATETDIEKP